MSCDGQVEFLLHEKMRLIDMLVCREQSATASPHSIRIILPSLTLAYNVYTLYR